MRRDGKPHRGWKKNDTAEKVLQDLQSRELQDVETCRKVWQEDRDPMALCEAVRQSAGIPAWLQDALLVVLTDGVFGDRPACMSELWKERFRHQNEAIRDYVLPRFAHYQTQAETTRGRTPF